MSIKILEVVMKLVCSLLVAGVIVIAGARSTVTAQSSEAHKIVSPQEVKWGPAPDVLPAGAQAAVLLGDPSKEGLFVLRLKFPKGYRVAPHTHSVPEVVTVISGSFRLGMGETAGPSKAQLLSAGRFFALPPGHVHHVFIDEDDTVIQISTNGPWDLIYVNPKDDPRQLELFGGGWQGRQCRPAACEAS
jgi:quercetin dioxygenase-like cupin family protein